MPDPQSVTVTSSSGTVIPNGSEVDLICSVQMNQHVLASDFLLLMVNAQLIKPDGSVLDLANPVMSGTNFTYTAQVISFGESDIGNYTCSAIVTSRHSSTFLTGMGQLDSSPLEIIVG